ncbi:hypothetical protein DUNSADRAFT_18102 [Dunaliella salina]|uniref:Uncharacterized protein n=1 Tax=Dunaliella salina TaxID=3046 RepID=A0ABQ7G0M6_DUNSA|nr:hypothetical protein DUNSADRAFT_18102 [Dunaliella salina]|eukprot:KAF5828162.1 hypothetical protein DUNSADRAFT_18102 [Dunaliella salina]
MSLLTFCARVLLAVGIDRRMTVHTYSDEGPHPCFVAPHSAELTCVRFAYRDSGCETMVITGGPASILLWDIASK